VVVEVGVAHFLPGGHSPGLLRHVPVGLHLDGELAVVVVAFGGDADVRAVGQVGGEVGHVQFLIHHMYLITPYEIKVNPCFVNGLGLSH